MEEGTTRFGQFDSRLAQICSLNVDTGIRPFRMTSVICTIGPSCETVETLCELINTGMNICRLNMAHSTKEYHLKLIKNIREAVRITESPSPVAIAVEIAGQGIRTGNLAPNFGEELMMNKGQEVILTNEESLHDNCDESTIYVDSLYFLQKAQVKDIVFIGDGLLSLVVKEKMDGDKLLVQVETEGHLTNLSHIHIPGLVPAPENKLTDKDKDCINFAMEHNIDMIFAAWVWTPEVLREIKAMLGNKAENMKVVACIENQAAIRNITEILAEADGIMVARGDLGMDLPPQKVFLAQKSLIGRANAAGKPVICAAQMLESMSVNARPTRAEAADVANAILDGADCLMLSRETAKGNAPVRALQTVCAIAREAEMAIHHDSLYRQLRSLTIIPTDNQHATAIASVEAANRSKASAIIVVTNSGQSAAAIARYRPPCLIVAVTKSQHVVRCLHLHRSIYPIVHDAADCEEWSDDIDFRIHHALRISLRRGYIKTGATCILVTGWMPGAGWTNTIRTITVPDLDTAPLHYVSLGNPQIHLGM